MAVFMNAFSHLGARASIKNAGSAKNIVEKILTSRNTLQSSDLAGETFYSVLNALKNNGVNNVKLVASKNGGYIVHANDIGRNTGLINLFPGGVMGPNGKLSVSFKFNSMGDCLQMTGVQKYTNGCAGASTIRTNAGITNLQKNGVKNPTEYIQVFKMNNSTGTPVRYVNKTYSPFANNVAENTAVKMDSEIAAQVKTSNIAKNTAQNAAKENSGYSGGLKFGRVSAEERKYMRQEAMQQEMLNNLREYNPELAEKVSKKLSDMRRKDWDRAEDFANGLVERYSNGQNDLAKFAKRSDDVFGSGYFANSIDDFWNQRM